MIPSFPSSFAEAVQHFSFTIYPYCATYRSASSCFFYMILSRKSSWYVRRGSHAKQYWDQKTEMVGELGSQLHNEKKLISLEIHYKSK